MKLFRNCRYQVYVHVPNKRLWSHHHSYKAAYRSFRKAVNNKRGDHAAGTVIDLRDVEGGRDQVLEQGVAQS